jgi:hypothetical protein
LQLSLTFLPDHSLWQKQRQFHSASLPLRHYSSIQALACMYISFQCFLLPASNTHTSLYHPTTLAFVSKHYFTHNTTVTYLTQQKCARCHDFTEPGELPYYTDLSYMTMPSRQELRNPKMARQGQNKGSQNKVLKWVLIFYFTPYMPTLILYSPVVKICTTCFKSLTLCIFLTRHIKSFIWFWE